MEILVYLVTVLVIILISMTLHEAMHGFAAYFLGDDTAKNHGRLTLNPIKHIDPFLTIILPVTLALLGGPVFGGAKPVPFNPARVKYDEWGGAIVAVAGPLTNFVLAFVLFGIYAVVYSAYGDGFATQALLLAVQVNLGFFIFNMLPIPPLDGSRVIYALAPDFVRRGMEVIEQYGIMLIFILVLFANSFIISIIQAGTEKMFTLFYMIFSVF